ncbi:DUF2442 domain-containing protein [Chromatium okenii]|jgi:hypothetical protein|uniref:DUF2442 domain-containing protein n=1 Tax=Chromatium okenii TaxID=61644 RepID=A0A2S7XNK8_9GAMM|nr:DUF2442 domain-containing protein [Chromatium okenii]PQJ95246.1 hypothetical protein CXB77_13355 [Chromatium okenii]
MNHCFFPKLTSVEALQPYCLRTHWNTGEVLDVNVETQLRRHAVLTPILNSDLFTRVHLGEWGNSIEWTDEEFGADNVYAWAKEQRGDISHEMLNEWMRRNALTSITAATALGIAENLIDDYRIARQNIPRTIWLACLGWEAIGSVRDHLPRVLPIFGHSTKLGSN